MAQEQLQHLDGDRLTAVAQSADAARPGVIRKKFAKPPVKVACLACRAARTRCDGQEPCSTCAGRRRECSYLPSKRGGPRKRKRKSISDEDNLQQNDAEETTILPSPVFQESSSGMFTQIDDLSIPGAGIRSTGYSSDVNNMLVDLLVSNNAGSSQVQMQPTPSPPTMPMRSLVRTYGSEQELLNAYYVFIHSYFPVLPPRVTPLLADRPLDSAGSWTNSSKEPVLHYKPRSPLSLAVSAILSLIPHPNDPEPASANSVAQRRNYAHVFAQMAIDSIEEDSELHSSFTDPSQALSDERPSIDREPFHPRTPVELEDLLALLILSTYEYIQRGNLRKMRYRAGQALGIALDMSLHSVGQEQDEFAEARRRAWWMTYYCVLQGSIVSTTVRMKFRPFFGNTPDIENYQAPSIVVQDSRYVTPYPFFSSDPEGWSVLLQAQQVLVLATQFILDLNKNIRSRNNMPYIYERMQQLDAQADSVVSQATLLPSVSQPHNHDDNMEVITARSVRFIARIKLSSAQIKIHRFRAFSDMPIFMKKHCDLGTINHSHTAPETSKSSNTSSGMANIRCSCSNLESFHGALPSAECSSSTPPGLRPTVSQYTSNEWPFSSHHSAKVCLRAALILSHMFQSLPFPQPLHGPGNTHNNTQPGPGMQQALPRTMPSFACCLMQGSYAMLMIFYKATVSKNAQLASENTNNTNNDQRIGNNNTQERLVEELRQGVERIIAAVRNYTVAFEALVGMRDEIEGAYNIAFFRQGF